jgi:predicted ABC-type transport system involved in lysophospholipase L1 biosynthesis ATPase subunit
LKGIRPFAFGMLLGSQISAARKQDVMIRLKNIVRYFENKFQRSYVLKDISLEINKGEFVTIMGPSGAGKTTLLNIIGLLDEPSSGEYFLNDEATHALRERKKATIHKDQIGFVFQAYHLIDELNVYENIETPLLYRTVNAKEKESPGGRHAGAFWAIFDERPLSCTTLWWSTTNGGGCQGHYR